jgi:hypothetical protein
MDINGIINEVRLAIDEENVSSGARISTALSTSLVEGIRSAAKHALRWLAVNAPVVLLDGSDETSGGAELNPGFVVTSTPVPVNNAVTLPGNFVRVERVRASSWHRAITECILDTSEEYLALSDETATATADRPVAAIVLDNPKRLELWPWSGAESQAELPTVTLTLSCIPTAALTALDTPPLTTKVPIPPKIHMPFIYYTAYLLLLSYKDSSAVAFRDAAITALGLNQK